MPKSPSRHKPGETCPRCGVVHLTKQGTPACVGHNRRDPSKPCIKAPLDGLAVCYTHGGGSPNAQQRHAEVKAAEFARQWGIPVDTSPTEAILQQVSVWAGLEAFYRERAAALTDDERIWGVTREKTGGEDYGTTQEAKPHTWIVLHERASANLVKFAAEALHIGIEERRVRLAEKHADALVAMLDGLVAALGHDPNDPATAEVVARHLELVA